ncbi:MAG: U32 family peptidase [Anaerolineae bacterium]|nr:U32 family peptidase [Anaerolineae bacterium]
MHAPTSPAAAAHRAGDRTTELLAPARDLACGIAAINAGADAIYIGAPRFGARSKAGNTLEDIAALLHHAHTYWARVYVTVNTLLHDHELPHAVDLIAELDAMGADGVIIQDVGLLECDLPSIPLIASTQMHNFTPERVKFLEDIGFHRVILARELNLDEIRSIRDATTAIELESFVHGALCVSYSGQCTMSYAVGGRSGNRGECAQPCRRRYSLMDSRGVTHLKGRYLLSLRDMNRIADLGALLDAGVTSFKIEGRLKDAAYVTTVVSAYRQALDDALVPRHLRGSSSGRSESAFTPSLQKVFNRGFTPYFLHGRALSPGAINTPKMIGEAIGAVVAVTDRTFILRTDVELHSGDGLSFFDSARELSGTVINGVRPTARGLEITPNSMDGIRIGTECFRNHDHAFQAEVEAHPPERTVGITLTLSETETGLRLQAQDEDGISAAADLEQGKSPAQKAAQAEETARRQLAKTGGTPFRCELVTLDWSRPYFVPVSQLNELRRQTLDRLTAARAQNRPIRRSATARNDVPYPEASLSYRGNVLNAKAAAFYRRHGVATIEPAAESGIDLTGRQVMSTRYCIKDELGWCPHQGSQPRFAEPLFLVDDTGHRYRLRFRCSDYPDQCGMDIDY